MKGWTGWVQIRLRTLKHRWSFVLGILMFPLGIWGIRFESSWAFTIAVIGITASGIAIWADLRSFRSETRSLQITASPRSVWEDAKPSAGDLGDEVRRFCRTIIQVNPSFNEWLRSVEVSGLPVPRVESGDISISIDTNDYDIFRSTGIEEQVRNYILIQYARQGRDMSNDAKVRLCTDLSAAKMFAGQSCILQKTRYFDGLVTNDFARSQVVKSGSKHPVYRGIDSCAEFLPGSDEATLMPLEQSYASNHIGVSLLARTSDGCLLVQLQGERNRQSPGQYVPSGSGSMDWADVAKGKDAPSRGFIALAADAALREFEQESGIGKQHLVAVKPIGMYRDMRRGGKPEFVFLGILDLVRAEAERRLKVRRQERRYVHSFDAWSLRSGNEREILERRHQSEVERIAPALDVAIHMLFELPEEQW